MSWMFGDLEPNAYQMLLLDPPWNFQTYSPKGWKKSAQRHYACMTLDEIKALPVRALADKNCMLGLWGTSPLLPQQIDCMRAWGFSYKAFVPWIKRTKNGALAFGPGYVIRTAAEVLLIGTIGSPPRSTRHRNVIEGVIREHSRKPVEGYEWIRSYAPNARRAYLFSRENVPGFECWGDEVDKFEKDAA